jgi:ATP synthase protein I
MSDGRRDQGGSDKQASDEASFSTRLRSLGTRLGKTGKGKPAETYSGRSTGSDPSAMARGFRLSTELVAGVIVGSLIGWLLDRWLGISPWGMIVFLLLGFAAGVLNVMRAAGVAPGSKLPGNDVDRT